MGLPNLFLQFTDTTWRHLVLNFKMGVSNPNHIWRRLKKMVHIVWVVSLLKCDAIAVKSTRVWLPYKFLMCARKSQLFRLKVEKIPFFNAKIWPLSEKKQFASIFGNMLQFGAKVWDIFATQFECSYLALVRKLHFSVWIWFEAKRNISYLSV